jgi:diphosphomevalonate decarboxylase
MSCELFVGVKADGTDSIAVQVADENHWPELSAVILVVSDKEKDTSSTYGNSSSSSSIGRSLSMIYFS